MFQSEEPLGVHRWPVLLVAIALYSSLVNGQALTAVADSSAVLPSVGSVPGPFQRYAQAVVTRLTNQEKAQLSMSGSLTRARGGAVPATIAIQFPGKVRFTDAAGASAVFDGENARGKNLNDQDDLLESVASDSIEAFLGAVSSNASVRLLGTRFAVEGETGFGKQVDIFEVAAPTNSRSDKRLRVKHFMFDSTTGLLRSVSYSAPERGGQFRVRTVYSSYSDVAGQLIPGRIQRLENDVEAFRFDRTSAALTPAAAATQFTEP